MASEEISLLLRNLAQAFDSTSFHGTTLWGSLRGLTAEVASWRPAPGRNSIHDLAVHCAYWKYVARRRITGEKRNSFYRPGSNFFETEASAWADDLEALRIQHRLLLETVAHLRPDALDRSPGRSRLTFRDLILGVAAHDLYHAGQIQLLKRLQVSLVSRPPKR